jgi:hypothetical protein
MSGWRWCWRSLRGLIIGALVLALDVFLQPGQAVYGAAG